jgi:geranylgeranylglycerol-phosphate geranylgeranyltransferase
MATVTVDGNRYEKVYGDTKPASFFQSQLILFQSRKKFAFLYCLATMTGLFCLPGVFAASSEAELLTLLWRTLPLPLASLLVTAGTYILNDLVDVDLDRANGKKRPIPSGQVSTRQAWSFVVLTFGIAAVLILLTFRPVSIVIGMLMLLIGITYSAPKIALMKRFIVKTVSIAIFYNLCALLGMTSFYNLDSAASDPLITIRVLLTLATAVFISSTLNDMGDVAGDKAAGRRTIPIVIGKDNTVKLAMLLAVAILAMTWAFYGAAAAAGRDGSLVLAAMTSAFALTIRMVMGRMRQGFHDAELLRKQHKKLFPLQMALHPITMVGAMMPI